MKKTIALLLTAAMTLSLAACGSSGSSGSTSSGSADTSTGTEQTTAADTSDETAAAQTTAAAASTGDFTTVDEGELHMATNAAFPPYEMTTDDGGYEGIDVEIATKIAEKLGLTLVVDDMDFSSVVSSVQLGKEDIAMAGLTVTDERKKNIDFTDSYATGVQVIIVPEDSDIESVDDLEGKMIGCQEGTTGCTYCQDDYGTDHVIAYTNGATAVQALLTNKVDAVVIDQEPAKQYVAANEGLKILSTEYVVEDYAIGVSKDNPELTAAINQALQELKDDGTVQEIVDKYINADGDAQ